MTDTRGKHVPPSIENLAFNCPHCGALAKQFWHSIHANQADKDSKPVFFDPDDSDPFSHIEDPVVRERLELWRAKISSGRPFLTQNQQYRSLDLENVSLSKCFNCDDIAIWIYDRLIWPRVGAGPVANPDLPAAARDDYDEASTILDISPRSAAALLRQAIQKLCVHLGEKGDQLNSDIGSLVKKGLDPRVQQALDVVRVIGNNAVHPGQIDLRDDRATAEKLFALVNLIAEIMITQPKHIREMYDSLPKSNLDAINKRDRAEKQD